MYTCEMLKCGEEWENNTKIMIFFHSIACQFYPGEELPNKVVTNAESIHSEDTEKYPF